MDFGLLDLDQNDDEMFDIRESSWLSKLSNQRKAIISMIESNHRDIVSLTGSNDQRELAADIKVISQNVYMEDALAETESSTISDEEPEGKMRSTYEDLLAKKIEALGEEPPDGILIAIQIATVPRIARRFSVTDDADFVYIWVASRPEVVSRGLRYGGFELIGPQNTLLAIGKTLAEQNIVHRTIFNVKTIE